MARRREHRSSFFAPLRAKYLFIDLTIQMRQSSFRSEMVASFTHIPLLKELGKSESAWNYKHSAPDGAKPDVRHIRRQSRLRR